jgi:hypothetical protein
MRALAPGALPSAASTRSPILPASSASDAADSQEMVEPQRTSTANWPGSAGAARSMMNTMPRPSVPLPAEFWGQARALWRKVQAEDVACCKRLDEIEAIFLARQRRRKNSLRPEQVVAIERLWSLMPAAYRVGMPRLRHPKKGLHIAEVRLTAHVAKCDLWAEGTTEHGLALSITSCNWDQRTGYRFDNQPLATFGLHALARRFQRGRDPSETAVLLDLAMLAKALMAEAQEHAGRYPVPGGQWRGRIAATDTTSGDGTVTTHPSVAIRTFIDDDSIEEAE